MFGNRDDATADDVAVLATRSDKHGNTVCTTRDHWEVMPELINLEAEGTTHDKCKYLDV
jgi:hypothetical protein